MSQGSKERWVIAASVTAVLAVGAGTYRHVSMRRAADAAEEAASREEAEEAELAAKAAEYEASLRRVGDLYADADRRRDERRAAQAEEERKKPDKIVRGIHEWTDENGVVHYGDAAATVGEAERERMRPARAPELADEADEAVKVAALQAAAQEEVEHVDGTVMGAMNRRALVAATVYTAPDCLECDKVLRLLTGLRVSLTLRDVTKDASARAELARLTGDPSRVPVTVMKGKPISGWHELHLRARVSQIQFDNDIRRRRGEAPDEEESD